MLATEDQPVDRLSVDKLLTMLQDIPGQLRAATRNEARAVVAPVLSHVWVREGLHAITPRPAFQPLLVGIWQWEVERGCLTGIHTPLPPSLMALAPYWIAHATPYQAAA